MIPLKHVRQYCKEFWNKSTYEELFSQFSECGKGDIPFRLYFPINETYNDGTRRFNNIKEEIEEYLNPKYYIKNYRTGIAKQYGSTREIKIGKLLKGSPSLLKKFSNDPIRDGVKAKARKLSVVISRHPYDIMKASNKRRWTSCLDFSGGQFRSRLKGEIKQGSLIAYLIFSEDKNIKNPLSRRFIRVYDPAKFVEEQKSIFVLSRNYGVTSVGFRKFLNEWTDKVNNIDTGGNFYRQRKGCYKETGEEREIDGWWTISKKINTVSELTAAINRLIRIKKTHRAFFTYREMSEHLSRGLEFDKDTNWHYFHLQNKKMFETAPIDDLEAFIQVSDFVIKKTNWDLYYLPRWLKRHKEFVKELKFKVEESKKQQKAA